MQQKSTIIKTTDLQQQFVIKVFLVAIAHKLYSVIKEHYNSSIVLKHGTGQRSSITNQLMSYLPPSLIRDSSLSLLLIFETSQKVKIKVAPLRLFQRASFSSQTFPDKYGFN